MPAQSAIPERRSDGTSESPTAGSGASNASADVQSPYFNKRRRLSAEDDHKLELRDNIAANRYRNPRSPAQRSQSVFVSPTTSNREVDKLAQAKNWPSSGHNSLHLQPRGFLGSRSPNHETRIPFESSGVDDRFDWRPTLPGLPPLTLSRGPAPSHLDRSNVNEVTLNSSRSGTQKYSQPLTSTFNPSMSAYSHPAFAYGYQQPQGQLYSGSSNHFPSHHRAASSSSHQITYLDNGLPYGMSDSGHESKPRKRRGNLPKETTDKLRAWFVAHLQHPYPTEDEKQNLMRQTGLQMSMPPSTKLASIDQHVLPY